MIGKICKGDTFEYKIWINCYPDPDIVRYGISEEDNEDSYWVTTKDGLHVARDSISKILTIEEARNVEIYQRFGGEPCSFEKNCQCGVCQANRLGPMEDY